MTIPDPNRQLLEECKHMLSELKSQATTDRETRRVSHHILGAAASLLGISFAVVGVIEALGHSLKTLVDDFALVSMLLFLASCLFSYTSMRSRRRAALYENIADVLFVLALLSLGVLAVTLYFGLIN